MNNTSLLFKNTMYLYIGKIVSQLLSFIVSIYVIRILSVEVFGTYNVLVSSVGLVSVLAFDPIRDVFFRYLPELNLEKDYKRIKKLLKLGTLISSITMLTVIIALFFSFDKLGVFLNIPHVSSYLIIFILYLIIISIEQIVESILSSLLLQKQLSLIRIFRSAIRTILLIVYLDSLTVNLLLSIEAGIGFLSILPGFILVLKKVLIQMPTQIPFTTSKIQKQKVINYGFFSSLNGLGMVVVNKTSDYFIISSMATMNATGLYSFANRIYGYLFQIIPLTEFYNVLRPLFFQKFSKSENQNEYNTYYNFIVKIMSPLYLIPTIYFLLFGQSVITLIFDPKYLDSYLTATTIICSGYLFALFFPLSLVIMQRERMDIALFSKVVVVFSIVGGVLGMKYVGILGVALVTLIFDLIKNLLMLFFLRKSCKIEYQYVLFISHFLIIFILCILFFPLITYITDFILLLIVTLTFFLFSIALTILFFPIVKEDNVLLSNICESSMPIKHFSKIIHPLIWIREKSEISFIFKIFQA